MEEAQDPATASLTGCAPPCEPSPPQLLGETRGISFMALLIRCSIAAYYALCRPLALTTRRTSLPAGSSTNRPGLTSAGPAGAAGGCSNCMLSLSNDEHNLGNSKECTYGCARLVGRPLYQRTLRQLIDDQQRAVAAFAVWERRRKAAMLQQEYQVLHQQASRALMDEHGQLFPHVCLCCLLSSASNAVNSPCLILAYTNALPFREHATLWISQWLVLILCGVHNNSGSPLGRYDTRTAVDAVPHGSQVEALREPSQPALELVGLHMELGLKARGPNGAAQ